jgi:putative tricarboxylic transport membrane protein
MSERSFSFILVVVGGLFAYFGLRIHVPFAYDPLGPKAFPIFLGIVLAVLSLGTMFSAKDTVKVFQGKVGRLALAMFFYFLTFQLLGFMLATTLAVFYVARLRGCSWMQGLLTGLVMAICFYGVFHFLLRVPLPLGHIFRVLG